MKRKALLFHRFIYRMVAFVLKVFQLRKYNFKTEIVPKMDENFIFISNHTTNYDFSIAGNASKETMYFVCEEALMKIPALGTLLKVVADPIPITTGQPSLIDIRKIMNRLHEGKNICLFPEGRHSYHGVTIKQENSIGKMIRLSGAALVTYRIRGGFFTKPRWSRNPRFGPVWGEVRGVYSSEQLRNMSVEEITEIINRDIYEDAFETQSKMHYKYTGKNKAEGLEKYTFICPKCYKHDTIRTKGDAFWCESCDLSGEYSEEGFLTGDNLPFDNIRDWAAFTEKEFKKHIAENIDSVLVSCDCEFSQKGSKEFKTSQLKCYFNKLTFGDMEFPFTDIKVMRVRYTDILIFIHNNTTYKVSGENFYAWKYAKIWHIFKDDKKEI